MTFVSFFYITWLVKREVPPGSWAWVLGFSLILQFSLSFHLPILSWFSKYINLTLLVGFVRFTYVDTTKSVTLLKMYFCWQICVIEFFLEFLIRVFGLSFALLKVLLKNPWPELNKSLQSFNRLKQPPFIFDN